jgi:GAF domain-containing protein
VFTTSDLSQLSKPEVYSELARQISALIENETDPVANLANTAALIYHSVPRLNWVGFYLLKGGELVLGPFQGASPASEFLLAAESWERARKN